MNVKTTDNIDDEFRIMLENDETALGGYTWLGMRWVKMKH